MWIFGTAAALTVAGAAGWRYATWLGTQPYVAGWPWAMWLMRRAGTGAWQNTAWGVALMDVLCVRPCRRRLPPVQD